MKYYHPTLFILLLGLTFAWLFLYWYRRNGVNDGIQEGFQQERAFVSKCGQPIYDSFYSDIYDVLMLSELRAQHLLDTIIRVSQPTLRYSSFLDVGCGTGAMMQALNDSGYRATGIDRSSDMIGFCQQKMFGGSHDAGGGHMHSDKVSFVNGDVLDSMQFDRGQFSHVLCSGMTLYEWKEAEVLRFFRNCYFWTVAGGYLFVHLVHPDRFSPVALAALSPNVDLSKSRVLDTSIDFQDFAYTSEYSVGGSGDTEGCSCMTRRESFIDSKTQHVRENELDLYMLPIDTVVSLALRSGFIVKAKWNLVDSPYADPYQFIYLFERTL